MTKMTVIEYTATNHTMGKRDTKAWSNDVIEHDSAMTFTHEEIARSIYNRVTDKSAAMRGRIIETIDHGDKGVGYVIKSAHGNPLLSGFFMVKAEPVIVIDDDLLCQRIAALAGGEFSIVNHMSVTTAIGAIADHLCDCEDDYKHVSPYELGKRISALVEQGVIVFKRDSNERVESVSVTPEPVIVDHTAALATAFATMLKDGIGETNFAAMRKLNATPTYPLNGACASHNYCDSNMVMAAALESVLGRSFDFDSDDDSDLFNAAWSHARTSHLIQAPHYAMEFPDFPESDMVAIPEGFRDISWRNDACPNFMNDAGDLLIFVDYANPDNREYVNTKRFTLSSYDDANGITPIIETDNWIELCNMITPAVMLPAFADIPAIVPAGVDYSKLDWIPIRKIDIAYNPYLQPGEYEEIKMLVKLHLPGKLTIRIKE